MDRIGILHQYFLDNEKQYDLLSLARRRMLISLCLVFFCLSLLVSFVILFVNPDPITFFLRFHVSLLMGGYLYLIRKGYSITFVSNLFIGHLFILLSFFCYFVVDGNYTAGLMFVLLILLSNYLSGNYFPWLIFLMASAVLVSSFLFQKKGLLPQLHLLPLPFEPQVNILFFIIVLMFFSNILEKTTQQIMNGLNSSLSIRLKERETFLKEIHHRVKNNLQVIMSLIALQTHQIDDQELVKILNQSQYRIGAMAATHEMLYQSKDFGNLEYAVFLNAFVKNLFQTMQIDDSEIRYSIEADNIYCNLDTAVPLGLIINEILTNSLKYAFKNVSDRFIYINIKQLTSVRVKMEIGDNGIGIDNNVHRPNSLGRSLIKNLTRQLEGHMSMDTSRKGTHYVIEFNRVN